MLNESKLKRKLFSILKTYPNIYYRKIGASKFLHAGMPDIYICYQARSIWLELKVYPRTLTPLQINEVNKLRTAGANTYVLIAFPRTGNKRNFYIYYNIDVGTWAEDLKEAVEMILKFPGGTA